MITKEEILLLDTIEIRKLIETNIDRDPHAIALDKRLTNASLIASQVKYLQRAAKKLPTYYDARAIIPSLSFEQSSSEAAAIHKSWNGTLCLDLTCGLGVDAYYLSKQFDKVITIEQNQLLAEIARINFVRLGADNITVINAKAEDFLLSYKAENCKADLIYADPDRRSEDGHKLVRLEDCSPDITTILPLMRKISDTIAVKLSPLFDIAEVFRIFGNGTTANVMSLNSECKEVIAEWNANSSQQTIKATISTIGEINYLYPPVKTPSNIKFSPPYKFMIIPDVALRKARITTTYCDEKLPEAYVQNNDGYIFTNNLLPENKTPNSQPILGKVFEILSLEKFDPKKLKKNLKENGIKGLDIYLHGFPLSAPDIARQLSVKEGGKTKIAFTRIEADLWVIRLK